MGTPLSEGSGPPAGQCDPTHLKNRQPPRNTRARGVNWASKYSRSKSNRASVGCAGTSQIQGGPQPSTYRTQRIHIKRSGARHNRKPTEVFIYVVLGNADKLPIQSTCPGFMQLHHLHHVSWIHHRTAKTTRSGFRLARSVDWTTHSQSRVNRGRAAKAPVWRTFNCCVIRRAQGCSSDYCWYIQRVRGKALGSTHHAAIKSPSNGSFLMCRYLSTWQVFFEPACILEQPGWAAEVECEERNSRLGLRWSETSANVKEFSKTCPYVF